MNVVMETECVHMYDHRAIDVIGSEDKRIDKVTEI